MVSTSIRPTARAAYQLLRGLLLFIVLACFAICVAIFAAPLQTTPQVMETWEFRGAIRNPIWPIISVCNAQSLNSSMKFSSLYHLQAILAVPPDIIELFSTMKDKEPEKLRTGGTLVVLIIVDILCFLLLLGASSITIAFAGMDVPLVGALSLAMVVAS
jgi:ABC-type transport system involved in multi-copper enzyme maturation permease subunit